MSNNDTVRDASAQMLEVGPYESTKNYTDHQRIPTA